MGLCRSNASISILLLLCACGEAPEPPEATLRHCMGSHARALPERRRPSFDEAIEFARVCGALPRAGKPRRSPTLKVEEERVNTLACAYSQQWNRCGRKQPTD